MTDDATISPVLAGDVLSMPISHEPVASADVVGGTPSSGTEVLHDGPGLEVGMWEITSGVVEDVEADEVFVVVAGRGRVDLPDGSSIPLAPGTAVRLHAGDRTRWVIYETLRKIYVSLPPNVVEGSSP